jgi:hypothetical protein
MKTAGKLSFAADAVDEAPRVPPCPRAYTVRSQVSSNSVAMDEASKSTFKGPERSSLLTLR